MLAAGLPRGLLMTTDELAGWFGAFDRYAGSGGDRAFWIEGYGDRSFGFARVSRDTIPINT